MGSINKLKEEIIHYGKLLLSTGMVIGTGGNISIYNRNEGVVLITPSGMKYEQLSVEDIVALNIEGELKQGSRKPSVEKNLHLEIYKSRLDVNAVIHTHSLFASAVAAARKDIPPILDEMAITFGGSIKTAEYAGVGTKELAKNAVKALGISPAALLANHGAVGVGSNLEQAYRICELIELSAKTFIFSSCIGGPVVIPQETIVKEKERISSIYGQQG